MPSNDRFYYKSSYRQSYALIVGIDEYQFSPPLGYAVSDAVAIRDLLVSKFEFPVDNVTLLQNKSATKSEVLRAIAKFSRETELDDRLMVFFAGHGHTIEGNRGDVGFLVPYDGHPDDFSSLIAWRELVSATQFLRAKHVLFVMDACYSGLALTRQLQPGSARFLKDMLLRRSRQVLTAGKADQVVADSGGPIPNHSVFTGHLIQALEGAAQDSYGVMTASGVLAYVYSKVSGDPGSEQTPHYGHVDGDGDFIFSAPQLSDLEKDASIDRDLLLSVPYAEEFTPTETRGEVVSKTKGFIASPQGSIELHDLVMAEARQFLASTSEDSFNLSQHFDLEELVRRLELYESATTRLALSLACVGYWGERGHLLSLQKCFARATDRLGVAAGMSIWIALRWYPIIRAMYCVGIAALDAGRYENLLAIFTTSVSGTEFQDARLLADAASAGVSNVYQYDLFKRLPGHERNHVPLSEYLFKNLQPILDEAFFMGNGYEESFDLFEVFFSLFVIDLRLSRKENGWGPLGRFVWKGRSHGRGPAGDLIAEGRRLGAKWPPLQVGFFDGSVDRFTAAAAALESLISNRF